MKNNDIENLLKTDEYYHINEVNEIISCEIKVFFNSLFDQKYIKPLSLDEAKKAAFKGEYEKAIGLYKDTLYYLHNDYTNLNNKVEQNRQSLIDDIQYQMKELEAKQETK